MPSHTMTLGVMALYSGKNRQLEEREYFKQLTIRGQRLGIAIIVFTPADLIDRQVLAHVYDVKMKQWRRSRMPIPSYIFDRCRYQPNIRFKQLQSFRAKFPHLHYLNRPLANKWHMHQVLSKHAQIRTHLPMTRMIRNYSDVLAMLDRKRCVYLKPINGTGGRGILQITRINGSFTLRGRDRSRRIVPKQTVAKAKLIERIKRWTHNQRFLVQEGLNIVLSNGRVHDYRMLIQKGRNGEWEYTGCAGRIGAKHSITSNLHGGGKAVAMDRLMKQWIPDERRAQSIQQQMKRLAFQVVTEVERRFGKLCEMALDLAVDKNGQIWLIELNPKPSRQVFLRVGAHETYETALQRPLEYALWLHERNG